MITSLGLKANVRPDKYKKARYVIINVSMKDLSNIIREFETLPYKGYDKKRPKHEPTDSYFYLARHLAKCIMRTDFLNSDNDPIRNKIIGLQHILVPHFWSIDKSKSKEFLADENLSRVCSTDEGESKIIIVDESST